MKGKDWYYQVNGVCQELAERYGVALIKVAGIMSALSPNNTFNSNLKSTEKFLRTRGNCKVACYNTQKNKALEILALDCATATIEQIKIILGKAKDSALKTKAFFDNIFRPHESMEVTVDRWMIRWAGIEGSLTPKRYRLVEDTIRDMAKTNGFMPHELQAVIWVELRGEAY